jgi:hypothetical protein
VQPRPSTGRRLELRHDYRQLRLDYGLKVRQTLHMTAAQTKPTGLRPAEMSPAEAIRQAAEMLVSGDYGAAARALAESFPPSCSATDRSTWSKLRLVRVFARDGFTDQYFGQPLVFPGTLRALSFLAPELFPYHRNWKQSRTHPAYWSHYPTIDHVRPLARGGQDNEANTVTTSMLRNAAKANWLVSELGWPEPHQRLTPDWDGLLPWFCRAYENDSSLRAQRVLADWYNAARGA